MTSISHKDHHDPTALERALRARIQGGVSFDTVTRGVYATDASIYQLMPIAVVEPLDEADVLAAVETAREFGAPILPRGGGTSLGGQAAGPSIVLDFSKHMDMILEINAAERWARVQPGAVRDNLNATLAPYGLHFAPDPATSSRATVGGMVGNNSSGTKSIVYGLTRDHVIALKVLLIDGTVLELKELSPGEYAARENGDATPREAEILKRFKRIIEVNRDEIARRFPKVMRRVQGYNLDAFIHTDRWNLAKLLVGSEGTLGVTLEATLNLEPLPKHKALCVAHFADLLEAIGSVADILSHGPSAVEILDADVVSRARENLAIAPLCGFVQGTPQAILIIEFFGESAEEASHKAVKLSAEMLARECGYAWPVIVDPGEQAKVWNVRLNGLGLMLGLKGKRKPIPFIEDACVPVEVLPEYIAKILDFCKDRDVPVAMYAHASVGLIHVRPILDLRQQQDIDSMKAIAEFSFGLVRQYGGSWSGEHGDGRVRSPFLERFFGPQVYGALREVKALFDPLGLMNPGPIIDPHPMDQHLRYGTAYRAPETPTNYHFREDGSFTAAVDMCTGVGACRQTLAGVMCPSYRATRDEEHSTRGRANALRLAMSGQFGSGGMTSDRLYEVMDLCLGCKACKSECPSNVDLARLKGEFLQRYHDARGITLQDRIVAGSAALAARMTGWKAPVIEKIQRTRLFRTGLELVAGLDRRRVPPSPAREPFHQWLAMHHPEADVEAGAKKVVLFDDTYINCYEPGIGAAAVALLESCGYEVVPAQAGCCQRPRISRGFLRDAKKAGEQTLRALDAWIQKGYKVVVCEPSCCSALTDDLVDLIDDVPMGRRIKANVMMIDVFLHAEIASGALTCAFESPYRKLRIHGHCHQKSLYGTAAMKAVLARVPGIDVEEIPAGCCGMAGAFGYEKQHYDLSMKIGEDRLFPAIRKMDNSTTVVACGFSCRHQIADGTGVKAVHWVETLRGVK